MSITVGEIKYYYFYLNYSSCLFLKSHIYCFFCLNRFYKYVNENIFFTLLMLILNHIKYIFIVFHKLINFGN